MQIYVPEKMDVENLDSGNEKNKFGNEEGVKILLSSCA